MRDRGDDLVKVFRMLKKQEVCVLAKTDEVRVLNLMHNFWISDSQIYCCFPTFTPADSSIGEHDIICASE